MVGSSHTGPRGGIITPVLKRGNRCSRDDTICLRASVSTGQAGFCTRIRFQVQVHPWCDSIFRTHGGQAAPGAGRELLCFLRGHSVPEWTVYGDPCFFTHPHGVPGPRQPRTLVKTILRRRSYALPGEPCSAGQPEFCRGTCFGDRGHSIGVTGLGACWNEKWGEAVFCESGEKYIHSPRPWARAGLQATPPWTASETGPAERATGTRQVLRPGGHGASPGRANAPLLVLPSCCIFQSPT